MPKNKVFLKLETIVHLRRCNWLESLSHYNCKRRMLREHEQTSQPKTKEMELLLFNRVTYNNNKLY